MAKMSDLDLAAIVAAKIQNALGYQGGRLSRERQQAERYYKGEPFGNELDGRSQVVSRDVAEAVDGMMPSLMRVFASGDEVVRFEPAGPEDEAAAAQATDYVNWVWNQQNDGFSIFHSWFKDALLKKTGIVKIWWDESTDTTRETYQGLTTAERDILAGDPDVEIVGEEERQVAAAVPPPPSGDGSPPPVDDGIRYDVVVRRTKRSGRIRVAPVPPDEFLMDRRAVGLDEAPFVAHRVRRTVSELIEMGYPRAVVMDLPIGNGEEGDFSLERLERFQDEDEWPWRDGEMQIDPSMREVWITETYLRVDYDGDGVAELRRITVAGEGSDPTILDNEEVDDHPFAALTPIPMPHKFFGLSVADQTMDLQLIKSTLWRGALDSVYLANAPQMGAVEGQVNLDDLLNRRPGGIVRLKSPTALVPIQTAPVSADAFQMIEYVDTVREQRTGVTRYNQGLDADTLNQTATGISAIQNASQQRLELIARIFAETGVKRAFRRILELVCKHQQQPQIVRLRGTWVAMDPREWSDQMDMTVSVGIGTGNKEQQIPQLMALLNLDERIVQIQGGVNGPLVTAKNVYNKLVKLVEAAGLKTATPYYTDPTTMPPRMPPGPTPGAVPPPPAPDPLAIQAEAEARRLAMLPQIEEMRARIAAEAEIEKAKIKAATEIEVARIRAGFEFGAKRRE